MGRTVRSRTLDCALTCSAAPPRHASYLNAKQKKKRGKAVAQPDDAGDEVRAGQLSLGVAGLKRRAQPPLQLHHHRSCSVSSWSLGTWCTRRPRPP